MYKRFSLTKDLGFAWNIYSWPHRLSEYHTMHKYTNLFVFLYCLRSTQRLLIQWCKTLILRLKRQLDFTIAYTLETLDFTISYAWNITLYYISYAWNVRLYYPCQQYTNLFLFRFASEHFLTARTLCVYFSTWKVESYFLQRLCQTLPPYVAYHSTVLRLFLHVCSNIPSYRLLKSRYSQHLRQGETCFRL